MFPGPSWISPLASLPQVEPPRNFILSPAMVSTPAAPAAPRRGPRWLALGWATTAATLLLVIVLAGDIFVVAPPTRQKASSFVALVPGEPQAATRRGYTTEEQVLEVEENFSQTAQEAREDKEAPAALVAVETAAEKEEAVEMPAMPKGEEQAAPVEKVLATMTPLPTLLPLTTDAVLAEMDAPATLVAVEVTAEREEPAEVYNADAMPAASEGEQAAPVEKVLATTTPQPVPPPSAALVGTATLETVTSQAIPTHPVTVALSYTEVTPEITSQPSSEQPEMTETPTDAVRLAGVGDEQQTATPPIDVYAGVEPTTQGWTAVPTVTIAPSPAPSSSAPLWLRGLELVLGLAVVVLAAATWIARRRR